MRKLKMMFEQWVLVSFAILVGIVIEGVVYRIVESDPLKNYYLDWYQLLAVVLAGLLCAIPTVLLIDDDSPIKLPFPVRAILHGLLVYLLIVAMGKVAGWYTNLGGFLMMTAVFAFVYIFVWLASLWYHRREDGKINQALDDIRDLE